MQGQDQLVGGDFWREWTSFSDSEYGILSYDLFRPTVNIWDSMQGIGKYYAGTVVDSTLYPIQSGGHWSNNENAGLYSIQMADTPSSTPTNMGF